MDGRLSLRDGHAHEGRKRARLRIDRGMKTFHEWLKVRDPDFVIDEGILDSLGRNKWVKGAVATAGLASGAAGMVNKASAAGVQVAPGVVVYAGKEGDEAVERATRAGNLSAQRGDLDPEQMMMVRNGPENWMVTNPEAAPDWYKPYLVNWYRRQIEIVGRTRGNPGLGRGGHAVQDDPGWIEKATRGDTEEVKHHTALVVDRSGESHEVQIDEPLKKPAELVSRLSDDYKRRLVRFYASKIDDLGEEVLSAAYKIEPFRN